MLASILSKKSTFKPVLAFSQRRSIYKKPQSFAKAFTKLDVDKFTLQVLFEYSHTPVEKVSLQSNFSRDLLLSESDRFGVYLDLLELFKISIPSDRSHTRDFYSGREASDWLAAQLEEHGRLADHP